MSFVADQPIKEKVKLYAHVILDRSGSMETMRTAAVDAYNEYCNSLKADPDIDAKISLTIFDSISIDHIRYAVDPETAKIKSFDFQPRGQTPLYDAIGKTVFAAGETAKDYERVAFVVLTDGQENASTEWTKERIKRLLERKQTEDKWLVLYLGANQDAMAEGMKFGAAGANSMTFNANASGVLRAVASSAQYTSRYAKSGDRSAGFTDEERNEQNKP